MAKPSFETMWERMKRHAGKKFHTTEGLVFTYEVLRESVITSRTHTPIMRSQFQLTYPRVPCKGPAGLPESVWGPSYAWAIMHDERVLLGED